ncbi:hypothetical protein caldi_26260 [Caldinitratiruptor microaerophilus]|uniref:Uncharacterized protein n=1 Tax=Caldinitratiruptor microaerophilus TaxID=671077 RepID=A0AA35G8Y0_9FIRM|nr:hypothetical protein caldi_26260 [Caldinitratiruptor microaerophilus]
MWQSLESLMLWAHAPRPLRRGGGTPPRGAVDGPGRPLPSTTPRTAAEFRKLELLPILPSVLTAFSAAGGTVVLPAPPQRPSEAHGATALRGRGSEPHGGCGRPWPGAPRAAAIYGTRLCCR